MRFELSLLPPRPSPWVRMTQGDEELAEELQAAPWAVGGLGPPWYVGHRRSRLEVALSLRPAHVLAEGGAACRWSDLELEELPPEPLRPLFLARERCDPYVAGAIFGWLSSTRVVIQRRAIIGAEWRTPSGRVQLWAEATLPGDPPQLWPAGR